MGNFYCNFTTRGAEQGAILATLRGARRRAFVTPTIRDVVVVFDRAAADFYEGEIDAVGSLLSRELKCPVLAAAVFDDDELWLKLYQDGTRTVDYSSRGRTGSAGAICRAFGRPWAIPLAWPLLQFPYVVFETLRHAALAKLLGFPTWCIGVDYRGIEEDELPFALEKGELQSTA